MITSNLLEFYQILKINQPIIAIDHGIKKLGIAISNNEKTIALPLVVMRHIEDKHKIQDIMDLILKYSATGIVIGLPINMNGTTSTQSIIVEKFARSLERLTDLPIFLQDERMSSKAADNFLKSFGVKRKNRNENDDAVAASMILETVLESLKRLQPIK